MCKETLPSLCQSPPSPARVSGSRACPHRQYFQSFSLLLWPNVGQFRYPVGTPGPSLRSCPAVSPSSTFPTVSSLSCHRGCGFLPLRRSSQPARLWAVCGVESVGCLGLCCPLSSSGVPQVLICCLVFALTWEEMFSNITRAADTQTVPSHFPGPGSGLPRERAGMQNSHRIFSLPKPGI